MVEDNSGPTLGIYANIMEEIKIRLNAINAGTGGAIFALPPPIILDHCYLQFRMICELLALACLVVHGDIRATRSVKLQKEWSAEKIMGALDSLHPNFYPYPVLIENQRPSGFDCKVAHPSPLPKAELLSIYRKCGEKLHRGSLKKIFSANPEVVYYPEITKTAQKFNDLLDKHMIVRVENDTALICVLRNGLKNGRCTVALAAWPKQQTKS